MTCHTMVKDRVRRRRIFRRVRRSEVDEKRSRERDDWLKAVSVQRRR